MFSEKNPYQHDKREVETTLHLRDVITVLTVTVSIAAAFFMHGSRLSIIENEQITEKQEIHDIMQVQQEQVQINFGLEKEIANASSNSQQNKADITVLKGTKKDK